MSQQEGLYLDILMEHAASASIVPFMPTITLEAMALFGGYHLTVPALVALTGLILGCCVNWLIGRGVAMARHRLPLLQHEHYDNACHWASRFGFILAAFHPMMLGSLLPLAAGILRVPFWKLLIAVTVGGAVSLHHYWLA